MLSLDELRGFGTGRGVLGLPEGVVGRIWGVELLPRRSFFAGIVGVVPNRSQTRSFSLSRIRLRSSTPRRAASCTWRSILALSSWTILEISARNSCTLRKRSGSSFNPGARARECEFERWRAGCSGRGVGGTVVERRYVGRSAKVLRFGRAGVASAGGAVDRRSGGGTGEYAFGTSRTGCDLWS